MLFTCPKYPISKSEFGRLGRLGGRKKSEPIPTSIFKKTQQWNLIELFAFLLPIIILHNVAAK